MLKLPTEMNPVLFFCIVVVSVLPVGILNFREIEKGRRRDRSWVEGRVKGEQKRMLKSSLPAYHAMPVHFSFPKEDSHCWIPLPFYLAHKKSI